MQLLYQQYVGHYHRWNTENPGKSIGNYLAFIWSVVTKMYHLSLTQVYLRKAEKGAGVMCRNKPSLLVKGSLRISSNVRIWSSIQQTRLSVFKNAELSIGAGTYINGARITAKHSVTIGKNCTIAPEVLIMDSDFHDMNDHSKEGISKSIVIEDHVWIATRAIVLKGITIGQHSIVAAGAVVTKDVPPYTVVAGNPARVIKELR